MLSERELVSLATAILLTRYITSNGLIPTGLFFTFTCHSISESNLIVQP